MKRLLSWLIYRLFRKKKNTTKVYRSKYYVKDGIEVWEIDTSKYEMK